MALSNIKKFTIIGNEISSNLMGLFLKYHLKLGNHKSKIDIYHLNSKEEKIFTSYRADFSQLEKGKFLTDSNNKFDVNILNRQYYDEMKSGFMNNEFSLNEFLAKNFDEENLRESANKYIYFIHLGKQII